MNSKLIMAFRLVMAMIFLWAFFDKLFGLGYSTVPENAWIRGVSPTSSFLTNATDGPFKQLFASLSGNLVIDLLFMGGLIGVGCSMFFGLLLRFGSFCGILMMLLIWLSSFPPLNNPLVDQHIVYMLVFLSIAMADDPGWKLSINWSSIKSADKDLEDE